MTTNKPEVQRYADIGSGQICPITNMYESDDGNYVLYKDYEALKAENEKLVSYTQNGIECFANPCLDHCWVNTPPFSEFQERYGGLSLMCVVDERNALRERVQELEAAFDALLDEYDDRKAQFGDEFLWNKHEDKYSIEQEKAALLREGGSND